MTKPKWRCRKCNILVDSFGQLEAHVTRVHPELWLSEAIEAKTYYPGDFAPTLLSKRTNEVIDD